MVKKSDKTQILLPPPNRDVEIENLELLSTDNNMTILRETKTGKCYS